jgi:hypothetical protein
VVNYSYLVLVHPLAGREEEWERWHREHVLEVLQIPGFVACRRFRLADPQPSAKIPDWRFMVLYEIDSDDVDQCLAELRRRVGSGEIKMSDASNPARTVALLWQPLSAHAAEG